LSFYLSKQPREKEFVQVDFSARCIAPLIEEPRLLSLSRIHRTPKQTISREQLLAVADIMSTTPKTTLKELRAQAIENKIFESEKKAPDQSTIYRRLQQLGFKWQKPRYSDPRAKRDRIQFERCCFRQAQQNGLDANGKILSFDESNFYFEQATRAWGSTYKPLF